MSDKLILGFADDMIIIFKIVNYFIYTAMVSLIGYSCYFLSVLFIGSMLFTAADAPPGDISNSGRLLTIAFNAFGTFIALFIYSVVHWTIAWFLNIPFPKRFILILNFIIISLVVGALIFKFIIIDGSYL
ncbi:MAG: hypothetical protein ABS935_02270 [Solibacillus sp.]|uniref:hypothetical protein n=1 Tax=Solibacillus sp. TaxID=1909654 RepID=UPI0033146E15